MRVPLLTMLLTLISGLASPGALGDIKTATSSGGWTDPGTWSGNVVPDTGDDVVINSGVTVTAAVSTASLHSLTNSGTLVFSGWNTVVTADTVRVNGTVSHLANDDATGGDGWSRDHRVYLVCTNLTVAAAGAIDVSALGYGSPETANATGYGPGGGSANSGGGGGGYGGTGGQAASAAGTDLRGAGGPAYGAPDQGDWPGSGGGSSHSGPPYAGGRGGGVVRIEATGTVTVNGNIVADGALRVGVYGGSGSGGGIYIACAQLTGNGRLAANGETADAYRGSGAGGRIVIACDDCTGWAGVAYAATGAYNPGEHGSMHLSDVRFLPEVVTTSVLFNTYGLTSWHPSRVAMTNAYLTFREDGFALTVDTDLTLTGSTLGTSNGNVTVLGDVRIDDSDLNLLAGGAQLLSMTVGGDVMLTNAATLTVHAGETNSTGLAYGALVTVTGTLWVTDGCAVYPWSQTVDGGSPHFRLGAARIDSGGAIDANGRGYHGTLQDQGYTPGEGPGGGNGTANDLIGGGGHGGQGGNANNGYGLTYGDPNAPIAAGSGGGGPGLTHYDPASHGGGVVWIDATGGTVRVDGTITASSGGDGSVNRYVGGGAGGSIHIVCHTLEGTGRFRADGADHSAGPEGGAGGGGRVALATAHSFVIATNVTASGGTSPTAPGGTGTVVWVQLPAEPRVATLAPTNVGYFSGWMNGQVLSTGTATTVATVYWGLTNGGTDAAQWANTNTFAAASPEGAVLSTNVTGLLAGETYFYRYAVSNAVGVGWAASSTNFTTTASLAIITNAPGSATDVTTTSATLNGTLVSTGTVVAVVKVFWGTADGGTNADAWAHTNLFPGYPAAGPLATNVPITQPNVWHYYTFYATNSAGETWATPIAEFLPGAVTLVADDAAAREKGPAKSGSFLVSRPPAGTGGALAVSYVVSGTADNGVDYETLSGTVTLPVGASNATVAVAPLMDDLTDDGETVVLTLVPGPYALGTATNDTVVIQDIAPGISNVWTGTGKWNNYSNWSDELAPIAGQHVVVAGSVELSTTTPLLASLTNNETLTFNTTNARLHAVDVSVFGVVTHAANTDTNGADGWAADNRVWIVCTNLTVAAGGRIDADAKGFGSPNTASGTGFGPGGGTCNNGGGGGGHGGAGARAANGRGEGGPAYGDAAAPELPGSGGGASHVPPYPGGRGGGVIRIVGTGIVTVDGTLTANGEKGTGALHTSYSGSGAGGSIYVTCATFGGSGRLRAVGELGADYSGDGGGGRISIDCANSAGWSGTVDAAAGPVKPGQHGTLYALNASMLRDTLTNQAFRLYGVSTWSPTTTLTIADAYVSVEGSVCALSVGAGLNVTDAHLSLSNGPIGVAGSVLVDGGEFIVYGGGTTLVTLTAGGDLVLTNAATCSVYSGSTNGVDPLYGGLVTVGGDLVVASGCEFRAISHGLNGGSLCLRPGGVRVESGGRLSADSAGFYGGLEGETRHPGHGPGGGNSSLNSLIGGGGYGGQGGNANNGYGLTYGSAALPLLPGSAGGSPGDPYYDVDNHGGGLVWIDAPDGVVRVDGTISASTAGDGAVGRYVGGGSGGAIYVVCRRLEGDGYLLAEGADHSSAFEGGAGGGGRIAVSSVQNLYTLTHASAAGGSSSANPGENGTVLWTQRAASGTVFLVR